VGHDVFATWKPFSLGGVHDHSQPCAVSEQMRDVALRCGTLFGLGLYGLDVLEGATGPVVVDLNSFPGYGDVPGIARVLARFIERYARGRASLAAA
jgi:ribosomal protein S6--L-glutamate ligase